MKLDFPKLPKKIREVYLDNAATTQIDSMVLKAMEPFNTSKYGNASSLYKLGRASYEAIMQSREKVADVLGTVSANIYFTGSGTESNNIAILGAARANKKYGKHIITTKIEHKSVLESCLQLEREGFSVTYIDVDSAGRVNPDDIKKSIKKDTILVSVMYANNEIGTVEPIEIIGKTILKKRKESGAVYPYLHTDACQAAGALSLEVEKLHVDLLTINGGKIYGPRGVGALYMRKGLKLEPLMYGGGQEAGLRVGTENTAAIVGLGAALEKANSIKEKEGHRLDELKKYFYEKIVSNIDNVDLNGPSLVQSSKRLPNNLNVRFKGIEGEALLLYLDEYGIMCSTGSACTSMTLKPSHVLLACGVIPEEIHGSVRFSLGRKTTKTDIDYVMKYLPRLVRNLRSISSVS